MNDIFENSTSRLGYSPLMGDISNLYNLNNPNRLGYTYVSSNYNKMTTLRELHTNLKEIVSRNPDFQNSLLDFYLKSQYEKYISTIQSKNGRNLCITSSNTQTLKDQLKKIVLIADTIVFNTTDFVKNPTLDAFPFPGGFDSDLVRVMYATEKETKHSFIPNAAELLSFIGMAITDKTLEPIHDSILGYDIDNPQNSYKRNQFYLSSTKQKDIHGIERPILVGLTERYNDSIYQFIFNEADYLFKNGNLVFTPYLRTSSNDNNTLHNVLKAGTLNSDLSVFDSSFSESSIQMNILENIDIPYIENVSIQTLSKIIKDEGDALASFRKQFHRAVEDLKELKDHESIKKELKYIKRNLFEDELDKVELLCKKVIKMKTLSAVGAVVTTGIIGISAYFGLDIASIVMATGGTGLATANELYRHYSDNQELKKNPMYLLWKIKSKNSSC